MNQLLVVACAGEEPEPHRIAQVGGHDERRF
jgi:hypothetical protein